MRKVTHSLLLLLLLQFLFFIPNEIPQSLKCFCLMFSEEEEEEEEDDNMSTTTNRGAKIPWKVCA